MAATFFFCGCLGVTVGGVQVKGDGCQKLHFQSEWSVVIFGALKRGERAG